MANRRLEPSAETVQRLRVSRGLSERELAERMDITVLTTNRFSAVTPREKRLLKTQYEMVWPQRKSPET